MVNRVLTNDLRALMRSKKDIYSILTVTGNFVSASIYLKDNITFPLMLSAQLNS